MHQTQRNIGSTLRGGYRYSFQGQEKDDEIKGEGNSINYTYRMHDPRVGRFFAVDPLSWKYPYYTTYAFSGNRVIDKIELEGLEPIDPETGLKITVDLYYDYTLWVEENPVVKVRDEDLVDEVYSYYWWRFGKFREDPDFYEDELGNWESGWRSTSESATEAVNGILGHGLSMTERPTDGKTLLAAESGTYVMGKGVRTENALGWETNDYQLLVVEQGVIKQVIYMTRGECDECEFNIEKVVTYSYRVETGTIEQSLHGETYVVTYEKTTLVRSTQNYNSETNVPEGQVQTEDVKSTYKFTGTEKKEKKAKKN